MKAKFLIPLFGIAATVVGCGGGGGGNAGVPAGATISTFATDSLNTDYDHVWVKIHKISLDDDSGAHTLLDDSAGRQIDLKTLRDGAGAKYAFLDQASVAAGGYTTVRVELDEDLSLVPTGSVLAESRKFAVAHAKAGAAGRSELRLPVTFNAAGRMNLVVDFDLANWDLDATGRVRAQLRRGDGNGIDDERRHVHEDFHGMVGSLAGTAPDQTFNLNRAGMSLRVKTNADTSVFFQSGAPNPGLRNGQKVEVSGAFIAGVLIASSIKIEDEANEDPHHLKGVASNLNEAAGTLTMTVISARGFVPDRTVYAVTTSATTHFMADGGGMLTKSAFFAALQAAGAGAQVEAEGTVNGGTFAARKLKIENEDANEAEIKGRITQINAGAGTLTMSALAWEGVSLQAGATVNVTTSGMTSFRLGNSVVGKAAFFAAIAVGGTVEAKGRYSGGTLAAIRLKTED